MQYNVNQYFYFTLIKINMLPTINTKQANPFTNVISFIFTNVEYVFLLPLVCNEGGMVKRLQRKERHRQIDDYEKSFTKIF